MANGMDSTKERFSLITRRLTEINGGETILEILASGGAPKCFWATAPTGKPHIAYFVPLVKLAEFARAGVDVTVLFCDLYAYLVNHKDPMNVVTWRTKYYRYCIAAVLDSLGVPAGAIHFVDGSSYELDREFSIDNYKLCTMVDEQEARDTGEEYRHSTKLSVLLCPGLPALAEQYLNADFQFGGEDQAGLFAFNEQVLPRLGYRKRAHMMNAMIPGLRGTKMSSSIPDSKVDLLDTPEMIQKKIFSAHCEDGVVHDNPILALLKEIILPISNLRLESLALKVDGSNASREGQSCMPRPFCSPGAPQGTLFSVPREDSDESVADHFRSYADLEQAFKEQLVDTNKLKKATAAAISDLLEAVRLSYEGNDEWQNIEKHAYPSKS